jgi:hypothetical protein
MCALIEFASLIALMGTLASVVLWVQLQRRATARLRTYHVHAWNVLARRRPWGVPIVERHIASVQLYLLLGEHRDMGDDVLDQITLRYRLAFVLTVVMAGASIFLLYQYAASCHQLT